MKLTGNNDNSLFSNLVNESVFFGNAPAPITLELVFQWFGLANTPERLFLNIFDQMVNKVLHVLK
jgi:hypothetical protein